MKKEIFGLTISLIIALVVGYTASWSRYYLSVLHSESTQLVNVLDIETSCLKAGFSDLNCISAYSFPVNSSSDQSLPILNMGVIVPAYAISCDNTGILLHFDSHVIGNRNSIAQVDLRKVTCKKSIDVSIWKGPYYPLRGIATGPVFYSSVYFSEIYYKITDFFFSDFRLILLLFFAFALSISIISNKLDLPHLCPSFPDAFLVPWAFFLLSSSGTLNILSGGAIPTELYVRLTALLSSICNMGPVLFVIFNRFLRRKTALILSVIITSSLPIAVPSWLSVYPLIAIFVGIVASVIAFKNRDYLAGSYFLVFFITFIKLEGGVVVNPANLPHIHFSPVFLGCLYLFTGLRRILLITQIFRLSVPNPSIMRISDSDAFMGGVLEFSSKILPPAKHQIFIFFSGSDRIRIFKSDDVFSKSHELSSSDLDPEILRAISLSTGDNLDAFIINETYEGGIITLRSFGQFYAVYKISFLDSHFDAASRADMRLSLHALADYLLRSLSRYFLLRKLEVTETRKDVTDLLRPAKSTSELFNVSKNYLNIKKVRGFIGEVSSDTRRVNVVDCFGYNEKIELFLKRLHFVSEDNGSTNAPIPLSISKRKTIIIENISFIKPYLSPYSFEFLSAAKTCSLAVIPFFISDDNGAERTFLFFADSDKESYFDHILLSELEYFFSCFITALVRINKIEVSQSMLNVLAKTVPTHVLEKLKNGESLREEARGFLLCVDIIGSTKLYRELGETKWSEFVGEVSLVLNEITKKYKGSSLDLVIWDAFFLTLSEDHSPAAVIATANETFVLINKLVSNYRDKVSDLGLRICLTFGDITKDFSKGINPSWTIVGSTMARICKFENSVKKFGPGIYIDPNIECDLNGFIPFISFDDSIIRAIDIRKAA